MGGCVPSRLDNDADTIRANRARQVEERYWEEAESLLRALFTEVDRMGGAGAFARPPVASSAGWGRSNATPSPRSPRRPATKVYATDAERIDAWLSRLPRESYDAHADAESAGAGRLKAMCASLHVDARGFLEASEYRAAIARSNGGTCCVCLEDYAPGEDLVRFACRHRLHFACARQAVFSDYERTKSVPRCPECRNEIRS